MNISLKPMDTMLKSNTRFKHIIFKKLDCCQVGCTNFPFEIFDRCALHCSNNVANDKYLPSFGMLFDEYVHKKIESQLEIIRSESEDEYEFRSADSAIDDYYEYLQIAEFIGLHESLRGYLPKIILRIDSIKFPQLKNMDIFSRETCGLLFWIGGVNFFRCSFASIFLNSNINIFYKKCRFINEITIHPFEEKEINNENYRYTSCKFESNILITDFKKLKIMFSNVFRNCIFKGNITIENLTIKGSLFKFPDPLIVIDNKNKNKVNSKVGKINFDEISNCHKFNSIFIKKCIFDSSFKFNGKPDDYIKRLNSFNFEINRDLFDITIITLKIEDSKFNMKYEIKNTVVQNFEFKNSNVKGIFDAYKSSFIKAKFHKSIFEEFAAFEYVVFGNKESKNRTDFIYTTFKDFSNFRNTKFKSGLNFSSANIKQEPNFLNTDINLVGTDRETLRIIKNSFEKVNNKIESNRFFIYEMMRYKKEVNSDVEESIDFLNFFFRVVFSGNEYVLNIMGSSQVFKNVMSAFSKKIVLSANYYISRFGESYIQPLMIFLFSIGIYTYILEVHKDIFSEEPIARYVVSLRNFVTQDWFISLSEILNACAANVPLFSKALEKKSGIEFISLLFFIWFGILTWQTIIAVKRNTQH